MLHTSGTSSDEAPASDRADGGSLVVALSPQECRIHEFECFSAAAIADAKIEELLQRAAQGWSWLAVISGSARGGELAFGATCLPIKSALESIDQAAYLIPSCLGALRARLDSDLE